MCCAEQSTEWPPEPALGREDRLVLTCMAALRYGSLQGSCEARRILLARWGLEKTLPPCGPAALALVQTPVPSPRGGGLRKCESCNLAALGPSHLLNEGNDLCLRVRRLNCIIYVSSWHTGGPQ